MRSKQTEADKELPEYRADAPRNRNRRERQATVPRPCGTEPAISAFLERVKEIAGILAVRTHGGKTLADQSILVEVHDLRSAAANGVYMLRRALLREYPDARLDVRVSAVRHGDTDAAPAVTIERC
jgi:hypothetical protein